jgi:ketosteroid isomerase-like protein
MPESEVMALRRIYDAFSRWDVDELAEAVTHDFEMVQPETLPWGGSFHGHEGVKAFADRFREQVDGQWADPDDFLDAGDSIVVCGRMRGRATATGRDFEVPFVHVWTMSMGMPARVRIHLDTALFLEALGSPPAA